VLETWGGIDPAGGMWYSEGKMMAGFVQLSDKMRMVGGKTRGKVTRRKVGR